MPTTNQLALQCATTAIYCYNNRCKFIHNPSLGLNHAPTISLGDSINTIDIAAIFSYNTCIAIVVVSIALTTIYLGWNCLLRCYENHTKQGCLN